MSDDKSLVPVWTLATGDVQVPPIAGNGPMTAERLAELRNVLAALADSPIATLEVHPLPDNLDRSWGIPLDAASPLAQHLSQLISKSASAPSPTLPTVGEGLYRMVVPAKVAAQFGQGLVRPMKSSAVPNGIYGALRNASGIAAQATFVPAGEAAAAGAAGGAAATGAVALGGSAALTVAAPLVLLAVAVGVSAHADYKRQQAIQHITELLEGLHEDKLEAERGELEGCRDAIDKATAILLDQGKLGLALGLDSAVFAISKAFAAADRRLQRWNDALAKMADSKQVELGTLTRAFPGIDERGGKFRAHLELAAVAIALKRRVIILQAVEHAQMDLSNPFENFVRAIKADQQRLDRLESDIASVLVRLSALELTRPHRLQDLVVTHSEVDRLLRASHRIHELGNGVEVNYRTSDVAIEIARSRDGSLVVFPATATAAAAAA
jgi:hypothetical protein